MRGDPHTLLTTVPVGIWLQERWQVLDHLLLEAVFATTSRASPRDSPNRQVTGARASASRGGPVSGHPGSSAPVSDFSLAAIPSPIFEGITLLASFDVGRAWDDPSDFDEHPSQPANLRADWGRSRLY